MTARDRSTATSEAGAARPGLILNFSSLAAGQAISMGLGFAAFAYLARAVSLESYGLIEYAVGLAGVAAIIIEGGMGPIGVMRVTRHPAGAKEVAAAVVGARVVLAMLVVPLVVLGGYLTSPDPRIATVIWLYALALFAIPFKQDWLLQALDRIKWVAPAQALRSAVFAASILWLVGGSHDLRRVGAAEAAAAAALTAYYLAVQRRFGVPLRATLRMSRVVPLIRSGAAVGASNIVWTFMLYVPVFLVTMLAGAAEAARLGSAQRIVYALVSFSALYFFSLYPAMARELTGRRSDWRQLVGNSYRLVAWTSLAVALMATFLARPIMVLVFGEAFAPAGIVFALYIWLLPIRLLSGHARWALVAGERQNLLLASELIAAFAVGVGGVLAIPDHGAVGAAAAVIAGNTIAWFAAHLLAQRHVAPMPGVRETLPPVAAAIASLAFALMLENLLVSLVVAAATYAACLGLTTISARTPRLAGTTGVPPG